LYLSDILFVILLLIVSLHHFAVVFLLLIILVFEAFHVEHLLLLELPVPLEFVFIVGLALHHTFSFHVVHFLDHLLHLVVILVVVHLIFFLLFLHHLVVILEQLLGFL